jgi:diguanylate cyclase (GGDEF)-like protein
MVLFSRLLQRRRMRSQTFRVSGWALFAASVVVAGSLLVLGAVLLIEMRNTDWRLALRASTNVVATIEADVARNIELYDLSLRAVVDNFNDPDVREINPRLRQLILFDRAATARYLGAMLLINEAGHVVANSNDLAPRWTDYSTRDYFRAHRDDPNVGLYVGRPFIAPTIGQYVIGISRRLSHPDGSFAGVVAGTLRVEYFRDLFNRVSMGPEAGMGVYRTDGTLITRLPYREQDIGINVANADFVKRSASEPEGYSEATAITDGVKRLYAYKRVKSSPLIVSVGMSLDTVYAGWRREALLVGTMGLLLAAATIALAVFAAYELRHRERAERKLAALANTDALTGVGNRRAFDDALQREWAEAARSGSSLALLMIDADHFKPYNDKYGHQAGDAALGAIAWCISNAAANSGAVTARYGGEEFSVLLPCASLHDGFRIAENIRKAVVALGQTFPNPTVSVGVACRSPREGDDPEDLVASADRALYEAKSKGRNRTASEQVAFIDPAREQAA